MSQVAIAVTVTAASWLAVFALFVVALRRRWFARFRAGFFLSMVIALVGASLMSASVVAAWSYEVAKGILADDLAIELQDVGRIVESEIAQDLKDISTGLQTFGTSVVPLLARGATANQFVDRLAAVQSFNPRFLQISVFDRDGRLIAATPGARPEQASRVAIGFGLDGKPYVSDAELSQASGRQVIELSLPLRAGTGPVVGVVTAWYDLQSELVDLIASAEFNQSGYAVMVDGDGQIIAHHDPARLNENISQYPAIQQARQTRRVGSITALNSQKLPRVFGYRPLPNPSTLGRQPWILLTEVDADEQMRPLIKVRRELLFGLALVLLAGLVIAHQVSRSIERPLVALGDFAHRVGSGDLTGRVDIAGHDVAGRLAASLNEMSTGLAERDHVKEIFGRYIATQVSDKILTGQPNLGGEARRVTILFSDIRNFTGMAEQMTPAQVVTFLNDYFSEMVDAVFEQNGMLDKFLGDGLMAVFGAFGETPDHPRSAVLAALRMKALLAKINGERAMTAKPAIAIGIGIHTDEVIVGNIGSRKRLEFTVVGDAVSVSSRLQGLNKELGTTILISETTFNAVKDEFECRQMPEAQLRGKAQTLTFYEVVSVRAPAGV
jgi:class 3 adenylate cyclase